MPPTPKFKKLVASDRPTTEAEVMARSAEAKSRGAKKPGRPPVDSPVKAISLSLPQELIVRLDQYALKNTGKNRSMAVCELLNKVI